MRRVSFFFFFPTDGHGRPETLALPGVERRGMDAALLRHPAGLLFPALYPSLQKQQVVKR